jgi:Flp pilus assembly protein TadD
MRFWTKLAAVSFNLTLAYSCSASPSPARLAVVSDPPMMATETIPVTTKSPAAAKLFEEAMASYEKLQLVGTQEKLKAAIGADPNFALAYAFQAYFATDPAVAAASRRRAKSLEPGVTHGEQLLIRWITSQQEGDFISAISAMNDMLAAYPRDKRMRMYVGEWLSNQDRYEQSARVLDEALKIDPNYAAAWNDLGYAYIYEGKVDEAVAALKKSATLLPGEPNPHDSLAEINRLAGHYDEALSEYREALKIQPTFVTSQAGIADTYSLMGQEQRARDEFAKAIAGADSREDALGFRFQSAMTYIREKDFQNADKAFTQLAEDADKAGLADLESQCYRAMAMYAKDLNGMLEDINRANAALRHNHQTAQTLLDAELAQNLRVRAFREAEAGNKDGAEATVKLLAALAEASRSEIVQRCYHAATGASFMADGKFTEAVPELQEDPADAISLKWLAVAYEKSGNAAEAKTTRDRMMLIHKITIEDAIATLGI